jgi:hypothetical protein
MNRGAGNTLVPSITVYVTVICNCWREAKYDHLGRKDLRPVYPGDFLVSMSLDRILTFSEASRLKFLVRGA